MTNLGKDWEYLQDPTKNSGEGIQVESKGLLRVKHNYIDRTGSGMKFNIIAGWNTEKIEITDNYLISPTEGGIAITTQGGTHSYIARNTIICTHPDSYGYFIDIFAVPNTIEYNIFKNCKIGIQPDDSNVPIVHNNIFINNKIAIGRHNNGNGREIFNNIFHLREGDIAYGYGDGDKIDNNIFFKNTQGMFGSGINSLSDWQSIHHTEDQNSIVADPLFFDLENNDFRIKKNSSAIETGKDLGKIIDFFGNKVGNPPNIGIDESN